MNYEGLDEEQLNLRATMDAYSKKELEFVLFAPILERQIAEKLATPSGKMITSDILDHLQKFDIYQVENYPIHWTHEMVMNAVKQSRWIDLAVEMRIMTIGQFRSLLVPL